MNAMLDRFVQQKHCTGEAESMSTLRKIVPELKIIVLKDAHNPTRKGTERYKRVDAVLKAKDVGSALRRGALVSTINYCRDKQLIRVAKRG